MPRVHERIAAARGATRNPTPTRKQHKSMPAPASMHAFCGGRLRVQAGRGRSALLGRPVAHQHLHGQEPQPGRHVQPPDGWAGGGQAARGGRLRAAGR